MIFHINSEKYRVCVVDQMCSYAVVREPYRSCVSSNISTFSADPPGPVGGGILCCVGEIWFGSFFFFILCLFSFAVFHSGRVCPILGTVFWRQSHRDAWSNLFQKRSNEVNSHVIGRQRPACLQVLLHIIWKN